VRPSDSAPEVVVVGGGVAGLEALLALRHLAGDRAQLTLVEPSREFVFRPMTVIEPFGTGEPARHPIADVATAAGARVVHATARAVEAGEHRVRLAGGARLSYDMLLLAPGARSLAPFDGAITFGEPGSTTEMRLLVASAAGGAVGSVAFVAPVRHGWSLPLYELALLTAAVTRREGRAIPRLVLVTPEAAPLERFGPEASDGVRRLLEVAGIEFLGSASADVREGRVLIGERSFEPDAIVALPMVRGPLLDGVPADEFGFIPVDGHGRVAGLDDVYAAGDAIAFPLKQGGLATQQADAAAEHIAAACGAHVDPAPLRPVLRGVLLTGDDRRFLRGEDGTLSQLPLWWPPTKVAGRHLAPYLASHDPAAVLADAPNGFVTVDVAVRPSP
jgi:sulfide:quinone oxidoreductase